MFYLWLELSIPLNFFFLIIKPWFEFPESYRKFLLARPTLIAQLVKNLPAMQETLVQFLGQEDPLEKG